MKQSRVVGDDLVHLVGWSEHSWRLGFGEKAQYHLKHPLSHLLADLYRQNN